jgi:ABC-type antimicrobial peptide transport system permease subunit
MLPMTSLRLRLRADLRLRWRALTSLALLLGLVGGVVLTAAAGARRTDTAYPRLLQWAHASQVDVLPGSPDPPYLAAVARLPQVAAMASVIQYQVGIPVPGGAPDVAVQALASPDDTLGVSVDRVKMLQGQMFTPTARGQVVIDPLLASREHLRPGDTLHLIAIPDNPVTQNPDQRLAFPLAFRVSGIGVFDDQIVPTTASDGEPTVLFSPPFTRTAAATRGYRQGTIVYMALAGVRLRQGANPASFASAALTLAKQFPLPQGQASPPVVVSLSDEVAATERAIRPQSVALAIFALLAGLIALAVAGQLLVRQLTLDAAEFPALRALGMTRRDLLALSMGRLACVTVPGAVIAAGVAVAASPLMPIGPARLAEPQPGAEVNLTILGAGLAVIALLPLAALIPAAWRSAGRARGILAAAERTAQARPSRLAAALGQAGSVASGIGVRMAFEPGRGRTAVPVRSAIAGTLLAVTAVCAAAIFGASLIGLVSTPHRYGENWDQELNTGFQGVSLAFAAKALKAEPLITDYAAGDTGQLSIGQVTVPAIGIDPVRGGGYLTLLAGREPSGPGEIALGRQTMHTLHRTIGQTVQVAVSWATGAQGSAARRTMRIVGEAVFPDFGLPGLSDTDLGTGALVSAALLSTPAPATGCSAHVTCYDFFLLRYPQGTDTGVTAATLRKAAAAAGCPISACTVTSDQRPGDITNFAAIRDTPLVLGAVLAVLAIGTLAHVLLTSVRRRRRDLAVLKTLGLSRAQVQRIVAWQATALAAAALLIGLPLGVLAGRWAWVVFANAAGVSGTPVVQVPLILAAVPGTLLLAVIISAWPGWNAARLRPAAVLRTE